MVRAFKSGSIILPEISTVGGCPLSVVPLCSSYVYIPGNFHVGEFTIFFSIAKIKFAKRLQVVCVHFTYAKIIFL